MSAASLTVSSLNLSFGGVKALDDVSFSIESGELFAVIGPNGAGKSSLLNVLTGIYRPQSGSVRLGDDELLGAPSERIAKMGVSRSFQNLGLFDSLSVLDNVLVGRSPQLRSGIVAGSLWWGRSRREETQARRHALELLDLLELADLANAHVGALPYGTKKRVELAKVLANAPRLLLLDEPVAGMNPEESARIADTVQLARREFGTSVLLIEHDLPMVMSLAARVLVLDFGQVVACGTPSQVQADPEVLRAYTGDSTDQAKSTAQELSS